jgi:hypothetical protein
VVNGVLRVEVGSVGEALIKSKLNVTIATSSAMSKLNAGMILKYRRRLRKKKMMKNMGYLWHWDVTKKMNTTCGFWIVVALTT